MEIRFSRKAQKYIQKCDYALGFKIRNEIDKIKADPLKAPSLKDNFKNVRSHHFFFKRCEYRIAYQIRDGILIVLVSSRENFYEKLSKT